MVLVEMESRRDNTVMSVHRDDLPHHHSRGDISTVSSKRTCENMRDTSTTAREGLEDPRQSFHTHTSILNVTSDAEDEEDDEEPITFLFGREDFNVSLNHSLDFDDTEIEEQKCCADPNGRSLLTGWADTWLDTSLQHVTESFVDSLCPSQSDESCGTSLTQVCGRTIRVSQQLQKQVELDILNLLGCQMNPTDDELDAWVTPLFWCPEESNPANSHLFPFKPEQPRPVHRTLYQRAARIRQFRYGRTASPPDVLILSSKSMDDYINPRDFSVLDEDPLEDVIGKGMDPIDMGYDSDPEDFYSARSTTGILGTSLLDEDADTYYPYDGHRERVASEMKNAMNLSYNNVTDMLVFDTVQETMNYTWNLTWHPRTDQVVNAKAMSVHVWIERGALLNMGTVVVEPKFTWLQVHTQQSRRGLAQTPFDVRVLNACRIVEASPGMDRTKYPMARTAKCFYLRTCAGEEYLFEAATPSERNDIVRRWKLVVARLASLAVMEDMETMATEFFTPVVRS